MNLHTIDFEKSSEKYLKAVVLLESFQAARHTSIPVDEMSPEQIYIAMDNELYDWNETCNLWQRVF